MRYYLSSYKLGNQIEKLQAMTAKNKKTAYIPNALDYATDLKRKQKSDEKNCKKLEEIGLEPDIIDLRDYFDSGKNSLEEKLNNYGCIRVRGGNTFVLRKAMKLSGFDEILQKYHENNHDIVYGGYSAGICILSPSLKGIHLADKPKEHPYKQNIETIREGLGLTNLYFAPHYKSDHPESAMVDNVVDYYLKHHMPCIALRDGEVFIIE